MSNLNNPQKNSATVYQSAIVFGVLGVVLVIAAIGIYQLTSAARHELAAAGYDEPIKPPPNPQPPTKAGVGLIPGEFDRHAGLMLCWRDAVTVENHPHRDALNASARRTMLDLIQRVCRDIRVIIVVPSKAEQQRATAELQAEQIPLDSVRFIVAPFSSMWIRDYGPVSVISPNHKPLWVTSDFLARKVRARDKLTAAHVAREFDIPCIQTPLHLDGGNLLSNGEGLLITTTNTLQRNRAYGYGKDDVNRLLRRYYGAKQIVYLEPLSEEPNGHVDMFAAFTSADTLVLGDYTAEQDAANREILNRNAAKLASVTARSGRLKVVRIPMPPRGTGEIFGGSYTNVVFANRTLVVPKFGNVDDDGLKKALATYRRLLPGWKVVPVESSAWIALGGSIHCLTNAVHKLEHSKTPE